ncbi:MAG: hypothetical protein Ct9H300mP23_12150 [Nitrospinota bacterium]|nr:MAG: hypothetical protein Ct9H300mP23_12150 [Nitrospinota bacterium]
MTESNQAEESIEHSIRKNGFPQKIVRLPFKPVYDACKNHGTNLSDVLDNLQEKQIFGKKFLATMLNFALGKRSILYHLILLQRMSFPG